MDVAWEVSASSEKLEDNEVEELSASAESPEGDGHGPTTGPGRGTGGRLTSGTGLWGGRGSSLYIALIQSGMAPLAGLDFLERVQSR